MTVQSPPAEGLTGILASRGNPLEACRVQPWLDQFTVVPENAAPPLAMSGPHPRAVGSYGAECIEFGRRELGVTYRWWQALAITRQLEHDESGALVWRETVETAPRRSGKSVRLRGSAAWRTKVGAERFGEPQLSMLVSKDLAVGKEIHRGLWRWAERAGWTVVRLGGAQEVESPAGDRWLLRAPNAAYGYDVGYGQVDESWGVDPMAITDGLEPALLERMSPQLHLTSTAHVKASSLMRRRLTAALRGGDPNVLLLMWGAHPDADVADEATWRAASPHWSEDRRELIARKYAAALAGQDEPEFDDPDPVRGWAAQYLNVWPLLIGGESSSKLKGWGRCGTDAPPPAQVSGLGVAANLEFSTLSLAAAGPEPLRHLGLVKRMPITQRAEFVAEVRRVAFAHGVPVAVGVKSPASPLIQDLEAAGVPVTLAAPEDWVQACADMKAAVEAGIVEHGNYPELDAAVGAMGLRKLYNRMVFAPHGGDIDALEAATWALWRATQSNPLDNIW